MDQQKGAYRVIRVDGTDTVIHSKPTLRAVHEAIGTACVDTVILDRVCQVVMIVDDTGMVDGKPVNEKATALAREAFGSRYPHSIHGDVAIVNDEDFE